MSPIQGFVRLRKHQFGRQSAPGTAVPATRAYPLSGTPTVDLKWTDPEIDAGSRDPVAAPYRGPGEYGFQAQYPSLGYNTITQILSAFFGGGVSPTGGGAAQTWLFEPASETVDEPDLYTYEFGDDVLTDWYQFRDGIITEFEITGPEGLGALSATATWRFGGVASTGSTDYPVDGTVPTPDLDVDTDEVYLYLKDMGIYIASSVAGLSGGQVLNALHTFVFRGSQEVDDKRFANGDQSFDIDDYGPGARSMEVALTLAKTDDTVGTGSESDAWMSSEAVNRYIQFKFIAVPVAESPSTHYALTITLPIRYYTREEGEVGGNTAIVLTGHTFFDPDDLEGVAEITLVNTLTEAELGFAAS